jgi:apolipoprotein N-acyltransferase
MPRLVLLSPTWRLVTATLMLVAGLTLPTYVLSLVLLPPVPPIVMIRSFVVGSALPLAVVAGILRLFRGSVALDAGTLRVRRADLAIDVPGSAVGAVQPWWIALPRPGVSLRVQGGRRLPCGFAFTQPLPLLDLLDAAGVATADARRHPSIVYAATRRVRHWWGPLVKFGLLGVLPASILFYTHQHIAYGGTFGQYYLEGPRAYWTTFVQYWATTAILLVSYASFWRAGAELVVWLAAAVAPARAGLARRLAEAICAIAYYGGVPVLLWLRYSAE